MLLEPSALILAEGPDLEGNLEDRGLCCDSCGSKSLRLSHQEPKPSWSELLGLDSECSPWWYAESQEREEKRRWDASMGEGYYDWYAAEVLRPSESARAQGALLNKPQDASTSSSGHGRSSGKRWRLLRRIVLMFW